MFVDGVGGASTAARCWTGRPSLPQTDGSDCLELSPPPVTSRQGNDHLYLLGCEQSTGVRGFSRPVVQVWNGNQVLIAVGRLLAEVVFKWVNYSGSRGFTFRVQQNEGGPWFPLSP